MDKEPKGAERRKFVRIRKNYILRFSSKDNPSVKTSISQIENISKGGICFSSTISFDTGDVLAIELKTPFLADTIYLEGKVVAVKEKIKGMIYDVRFQFENISPLSADVLDRIEKYNMSGENQ